MKSWTTLPDAVLKNVGEASAAFLAQGVAGYQTAGRYVHQLPYGRNTDRANYRLVLAEKRGTCSTKHALLAALAIEQNLPVFLTLGIYEMHERNTPGVGKVLDRYNLSFIPEAHCYLTYNGARIDVTRSGLEPTAPIAAFLFEEPILPEQIGDYKVHTHQRFLREWAARSVVASGRRFEEIWKIREECIAALAQ